MRSRRPKRSGFTSVWRPLLTRNGYGWLGCWLPRAITSCLAKRSMSCAIGSMSWEPGGWRQPPTSGKKRGGYEGASLVCPHCQRDARFVQRRGKWCESLLGPLRIQRCYYHCRGCGRGHVPWDRQLGLGARALTPAASEVTSIAGVQNSFAQSSEVTLRKLCGLRLSESTVERVTEAAGEGGAKLLGGQKK